MSPLRVFVVDPDERRARWVARLVAARGHEVVVVGDGERAIDRFVQAPADAVFVEYVLPGRDGVATVEAIRWAPGGRDVRVILLAREEPASAPLQMLALRVDATSALVGELTEGQIEQALDDLERGAFDEGTLALEDDSYARHLKHAQRESVSPMATADWLDAATVIAGALRAGPAATPGRTPAEEATSRGAELGRGRLDPVGIETLVARGGDGGEPPEELSDLVLRAPDDRPPATFDDLTVTEAGEAAAIEDTVSLRALTAGDARAILGIAAGKFSGRPFAKPAAGRFAPRTPTSTFRAPASSGRPFSAGRTGQTGATTDVPSDEESAPWSVAPWDPPQAAAGPPSLAEREEPRPAAAERSAVGVVPSPAAPRAERLDGSEERATHEFLRDPQTVDEGRFVRSQAQESEGEWRGSFAGMPFPALLRRIADERASGGLVCTLEDSRGHDARSARATVDGEVPTKVVYFRGGVPVQVRSNLVDECLGQLLMRKKRIGIATLEESIRRMRDGRGLQGRILVEMGALAPLELSELLSEQVRQKLFDLFGWRRGEYRFAAKLEPPRDGIALEMALPDMVYEGVCAAMPATLLLDIMTPRLELFVVPDPMRLSRFARVKVAPDLRATLERLDGSQRLREVLRGGPRPGAIAQLVYALECLGAVDFERAPRVRAVDLPPLSVSDQSLPASDQAPHDEGAAWDDVTSQQPERAPTPDEPPARVPTAPEGDVVQMPTPRPFLGPSLVGQRGAAPEEALASVSISGLVEVPSHEAPAAVTGPHAPVVAQGALDAHVDRMFEAERCFRRGNRSLARGEHRDALSAFERAAELCPEEAEFVAYLGWARHCVDPSGAAATQAALSDLQRSAELAPDLHVTHLLHGRVLEHAGRADEALRAFHAVLALEPGTHEAEEAVARLGRGARW